MNEPYNNYYILQTSPLWLTHHHWYISKEMSVQINDSRLLLTGTYPNGNIMTL
ncbi:hypothetical protein [Polluticaenibacter yanchengensis]|uniref:Uncharacterized protein n=1 Tax=Polluticaenibacter yanchengensis TaxID=3014562 RepID=A0ABT4UH43_9BACT|nr:hypothetical protein [Chitinophagaceae bacterium LY-5]